MFTGGALQNCAVFALGIMPYITSAIIMQMLTAVVPSLERLKQEGETGRAKLVQYSRYMTVMICIFQSAALAATIQSPDALARMFNGFQGTLVANPGIPFTVLTVITITSGTVLLMWLGEQITERGIGNGASIIITVGIVDRLPTAIVQAWQLLFQKAEADSAVLPGPLMVLLLLAMMVLVTAGIIAVTQAQRKIPVQYAKRMVGQKMMGGGSTFMPLRVNYSGVMPIIFASAILQFPQFLFSMSKLAIFQRIWTGAEGR